MNTLNRYYKISLRLQIKFNNSAVKEKRKKIRFGWGHDSE